MPTEAESIHDTGVKLNCNCFVLAHIPDCNNLDLERSPVLTVSPCHHYAGYSHEPRAARGQKYQQEQASNVNSIIQVSIKPKSRVASHNVSAIRKVIATEGGHPAESFRR